MNVAQVIRQALYDINAVRQESTTDPFYVQTEMLAWANAGKEEMERAYRSAEQDYQLVIVQSNDVSYRWCGQTYDPSVLQLTSGTKLYTLPPDLLTLKRIRVITSGYENIRFIPIDMTHQAFKDIEAITSSPPYDPMYFDVVGERTLYIPNPPSTSLDIEIAYIGRYSPLQIYTTGTCSISQNSAALTGTSTQWVIDELQHTLEWIPGTAGNTPKIVSQTTGGVWVDPSVFYYRVDTISADGNITLSAPWLDTALSGAGYMLASTPSYPREDRHPLVDYVAARACRKKQRWADHDKFMAAWEVVLGRIKGDKKERQTHEIERVEDYDPSLGYGV